MPPLNCSDAAEKHIGGDLDSTPVSNPKVHAEMATGLVNPLLQFIVANDDNYALAA